MLINSLAEGCVLECVCVCKCVCVSVFFLSFFSAFSSLFMFLSVLLVEGKRRHAVEGYIFIHFKSTSTTIEIFYV